jgi:protein gp37
MAERTGISWTDATFNPWRGCAKVSDGCKNCYAETFSGRNPAVLGVWGPNGTRPVAAESAWRQPRAWDRKAARDGVRRRVFCASLSDVFEDRPDLEAPRARLWDLIRATPHLDWQVLTKRPELIGKLMPAGAWPNVWLGTSVESQEWAWRIDALGDAPQEVPVRFLSAEPLLGPLTLWDVLGGIQWVIVGGESGGEARPCRLAWVRDLVIQCEDRNVAVFVKQLGRRPVLPDRPGLFPVAIADAKGGDVEEFPADLRVRRFPR